MIISTTDSLAISKKKVLWYHRILFLPALENTRQGKPPHRRSKWGKLRGRFLCIGIVFLLLSIIVDGVVTGVGIFMDLAVANTQEAAHAGQPGPETANPRNHVKVSNQV